MLHASVEIAALPFLWPTRLADGLELEVFYTKRPVECFMIRPGFRLCETCGSPALRALLRGNFGRH